MNAYSTTDCFFLFLGGGLAVHKRRLCFYQIVFVVVAVIIFSVLSRGDYLDQRDTLLGE